uniref:Uncharacterized protein n=1 Tax=Octopus bimaculoides TaxID=37653 RepID=A0A0L8HM32_OCTBM
MGWHDDTEDHDYCWEFRLHDCVRQRSTCCSGSSSSVLGRKSSCWRRATSCLAPAGVSTCRSASWCVNGKNKNNGSNSSPSSNAYINSN